MYDGTVGATIVLCKQLIVKSWKTNPPTFCELWEEAAGSPTVPESGRPSCLVISPSLSALSLLNRISLQLTKCHASEGSLISPASQTFYFSILLSSKGHLLLQQHKAHVALHNMFFASCPFIRLFFRIREKERIEKAHWPLSEVWLCITMSSWRYFWCKISVSLYLAFTYYWKMNTLFFLPTQSLKHSRTQRGSRGTWSSVCFRRKAMLLDCQWFFVSHTLKTPWSKIKMLACW